MDKIDGYVNKAELRVYMEQRYHIPQAKFYRVWPKISHKFESKKAGKTILIKLKEEDENESNI